MSLIQEALRRQQEEMQAAKNNTPATDATGEPGQKSPEEPKTVATPPIPKEAEPEPKDAVETQVSDETFILPTTAEPSAEPEEEDEPSEDAAPTDEAPEPPLRRTSAEREHRVLGPLVGMLVVIVLLAGVVGWAIRWGYRALATDDTQPEQGTVAEPTPAEPESTPAVVDVETDETTITETEPDTDEAVADVAVVEPDTQTPTDTSDPVTPDTPEEDIAVTEQPTPAPSVIWPELHISGIMGTGDSGSAIINGKVVGPDEKVGDVTVRDFGRGFVVLEYQGETRRFSVGRATR